MRVTEQVLIRTYSAVLSSLVITLPEAKLAEMGSAPSNSLRGVLLGLVLVMFTGLRFAQQVSLQPSCRRGEKSGPFSFDLFRG